MKTNARKYISLLLALCMVMSLLPAAALAAGADDDHGEHSDWTALTNLGGTLTGGSYYLTGNLNASSGQISVTGTVNLCLNGHTLNLNEKSLCVDSGSFTLCDCKGSGKITGGKYLPGVIVYGGTFTMNGGTITGNGGGVIVGANPSSSASFTMNGGSITGNTVNTNVTTTYGGGVYVANGSSFTMTGGSITGNTVTGTAAMTASGGVLVVNSGSSFTMTGGEITNNQCDGTMSGNDFAGGVRVSSFLSGGSFTVSGDAVISGNTAKGSANNVSLTGSQTINIGSGGLSSGAEIGVTMASAGVFTTGGGESCRQYFFSDDDTYVVVPSNGELALGLVSSNPHTHCVCGETLCNEHGGEQTFDPLSSLSSTIGPGNYYLTKNLTNGTNGHITVSGNVTLCLNGRTLDLDGHHFIVNSGGSLTICDCGSGGTITGGQAEQGGAVLVNSGGSLTLHSGSITGNTASGGGDGSSGSNRAGGGAVCVNGGSFNMTGGSIENNTANVTKKNDGGGGVLINSGSFTMSGGSITDNSVSGHDDSTGGGVHVNSGTFTMTGGAIANNNAKNGGGVTVFKSNSTANSSFILSGGRITNNSATTAGGIYVLPNTEFKLSGEPAISGNTADGADSNIYLNGPVITLTGALSNATPYGVSMARPGEFTSGGGATYIDNFTSDDSNLDVQISGDELCLSSGFTVSFDLNGGTGIASEQKVQRGGKATDPGKPTRDDHAFAGWYNGDTLWNFDTVVTGNMILTAKWITNPTVTVTGDTSLTYGTGGTLTASVSPAGQNYTYQWSCNGNAISGATGSSYTIPADTAVGTYTYSCTVTASIAGSSKTARATSDAVTVTVSAKGYDSNSFTVSDIADQTYTGSQIKPEPEVKFGDITLQKGTDYTLGYGTNINVGTGSVTITFKGNYSGETTVYFDIVKAAQTAPGDGEGYTIDYEDETITVRNGYEVYTAQSGGTQITSGSITDYLGQTLYIRKTETGTHNASDWTQFNIASRPAAPSVNAVAETIRDKRDGKVTGVDATMEYKIGDGAWQDCTGTEITDLAAGTTVTVRVKATTTAPHGEESTCIIEEGDTLTVTFDENGGSEVNDITGLSYNDKISAPEITRAGYTLDGWYNGNAKWDFATGVTADLTLTAKWTLDAPTVSLTADKNNVTYGTEITLTATATHIANLSYTYEWDKDGEKLDGQTGRSLTIKNVNDSGKYTVKVTATDMDGLTAEKTSDAVIVSIGKADPVTAWPTASPITYGDSLSESDLTGGQAVDGTFAWEDGNVNPTSGSHSYTVTFTPTDKANYNSVEQSVTVQVNRATLTPSVGSVQDKVYDGDVDTTGTIELEGAVLNENPTAGGVFTFEDASAGTGKTTVNVTVTLNGSWGNNYVLSDTTLETTANITPKTVGLTWSGHENLVYDGSAVSVTAEATGLVDGDQCAVTVENGDQTDAGTYTAKATGLGNDNYQLPDTGTTQEYTIAPRPVELSWSESSFTYDGDEKTVTATITNLVPDDDCALTYSDNAKTEHGNYTATVTGLDNNNYTLTNGAGLTHSWSIGKAVVSFTVSGNSHTYDGEPKIAVVTQDEGQTQIPAGGYEVKYGGAVSQTEAGTYDITVTIMNNNFCFEGGKDSMVVGQLTIGEQAVTIPAADDTEFVYNGSEQTYAIAESELYTVEGNVQKDAGTYTVTVSLNDKDNYVWSDDTTDDRSYTFAISPKAVTATWVGLEQVYGSVEPVSVVLSGLAEGDEGIEAVISGVSTEAGEHPLNASLKNYDIINGTATLRIQQKPVTITVTDNAVTVGSEPAISAPGLAESDYEVIYKDKNGNEVTPSEPGTYEVWVEITNPNYRHPDGGSEKQVGSVVVSSGTPRTYEVSFAGSGGGGSTAGMKAAGGSVITLPECGFTKPGSVFTGWKYFNVVYKSGDSFTMPSGDVIFTAQWAQSQSVGGKVQDKGGAPVEGAAVSIWQGSNKLDEDVTGSNGAYSFPDLAPGSYNVSVSTGEKTVTTVVTVDENGQVTGGNIVLSEGNISTRVDVTPGSPDIVVGDLDGAFTDADKETAASGGTVEIAVKVEQKPESGLAPGEAEQLEDKADGELSLFVDISLDKTTTPSGGTAQVESGVSSEGLLTIIIPLPTELKAKDIYTVVRTDGATGEMLSSEPDELSEEYYELTEDGSGLVLHVKESGVYAVGGRDYQIVIPTYPPVKTESENGSFAVSPDRPFSGQTVTITPKPDEGYTVDKVTVTDADGKPVEVTKNVNGTYSFTQPSGRVTITVTFKVLTALSECPRDASCPMSGYTDLNMGEWYHDGIHYCLDEGLMDGVDAGMFAPNATTSRAMIVTILWRLQGSPEAEAEETFTDVAPGDWYADAIAWAAAEGVAEGYEDGSFRPNDAITREQLAAMLWRYAASPETGGDLSAFADGDDTSDWAQQAMSWAVAQGLITGVDSDRLAPRGPATRAQTATILMRFAQSETK
uniref:S-layer homology domain-containing protein n=1 Tax=Candidatus Scatomorpha intestinigallinarum TaxID=2840923 RepID=UPI004026C50B